MRLENFSFRIAVLSLSLASVVDVGHAQPPAAWTIVRAQVADGTGAALRVANVRVVGDSIVSVGAEAPQAGDRTVDGTGLIVAPGFIDVHNHSTDGLATDREAASQISQGITTVLVGPDGSSPKSIADYLAARRANAATVNVGTLVGHATVRQQVMGDDYRRTATHDEIERMAVLVDRAMLDGALGLSSGLEYVVGSYASTDEVVALATASAKRRGIYISHIRDEADRTLDEAVGGPCEKKARNNQSRGH